MVQLAAGPSKREVLKVTEKFQSAGPSNATWQPLPPNGSRTALGPGDIACQRFRLDQVRCKGWLGVLFPVFCFGMARAGWRTGSKRERW